MANPAVVFEVGGGGSHVGVLFIDPAQARRRRNAV